MPETIKNTRKQTDKKSDDDRALARALVERKVLTLQQAKSLLAQVKNGKSDQSFESLLIQSEITTEDVILETKASIWHVPYIDLKNYEIDPEVLDLIPGDVARQYHFFPLFKIDSTLLLAMTDPKDIKAIDKVTRLTQLEISPALSAKDAVESAIDRYYGKKSESSISVSNEEFQEVLEVIESEEEIEDIHESVQDLEKLAEEAPVVKMANMILTQAILEGASDVHINPEENELRVRFRHDGVLHESFQLPKNLQAAIISRIKILSNLDIAEHRIPQDGQLRLKLKDGRHIDIRVSTLPSVNGENVVLRILDKSAALLQLDNLGFEDDVLKAVKGLLNNAYGIILVTGPTGSGKTTTLYASLNHLDAVSKNIITLEDPVEFRLPRIRQSQVNVKAGMTFAKGLRAILRQDPDIVLVGEIRDTETANIAVQAALTGHLVLSTLHTNDAAGGVTRLAEMEIEPFLISSAVLGIMAQRLIRKICPDCKEEYHPNFEIPKYIFDSFGLEDTDSLKFYHGKGCKKCRDSGYKGRMAIMEVVLMTDRIRQLVLKSAPSDEIRKAAVEENMRPLLHDGWVKVLKGITTIEEVLRVTNIE
jgi:type IV pilus assembly protein PilB